MNILRSILLLTFWVAFSQFAVASSSVFTALPPDAKAVVLEKGAFGVHGNGIDDDTQALQAAIDQVEHTTRQGIVFLPEGTYRLTKTVYIWTGIRVIGVGKQRPVLLLGASTPGYQQGTGHYMVHFVGNKPGPGRPIADANASTFYSGMMNVDFVVEAGNEAAVGIRFHVAQHSFLSHMEFRMQSGHAALEDIGNQASDLRFVGGDYGIDTHKTAPAWQFLLMDSSFEGQRLAAIRTQEAGLTLIRDRFEHVPVGVQVRDGQVEQLYARDSLFREVPRAAIALGETRNFLSQITLERIECVHVPTFSTDAQDSPLQAPAPYYQARRFTRGLRIDAEGREVGVQTTHDLVAEKTAGELPASDIPALPAVEQWQNARGEGVKGDNETDDTEALQQVINAHRTVYLPSGRYVISHTLHLRPDTVLIGLSPITTQLVLKDGTQAYAGVGSPVAMVEAPQGGKTVISGIGISTNGINDRAVGLLWQAGPQSFVDDVKLIGGHGSVDPDGRWSAIYDGDHTGDPNPMRRWDAQYPSLWVRGGGGIFRNIWTASSFARAGFVVQDTSAPGTVYQLSSEHHVRNEVEFHNVHGWVVEDLQLETEKNEGAEAVALDLRNTSDLHFDNLFIYRVSRVLVPAVTGIVVQSASGTTFQNVHSYSGTRFAFDNTLRDASRNLTVHAANFNFFAVEGTQTIKDHATPPAVFAGGLTRLATGFSNATGLTASSEGDAYFTDQRMQRIYRWSAVRDRLEVVQEAAISPVALILNGKSILGVSSFKSVVKLDQPAYDVETVSAQALGEQSVILPTGTHPALYEVRQLLTSGQAFENIAASGTWLALLQSSQLGIYHRDQPTLLVTENDALTWKVTWKGGRELEAVPFIFRGGCAVVQDAAGNIYIADGQVFVYDHSGQPLGVLEVPEKPTGLALTAGAHPQLLIAARTSLYRIGLK